MDNYKTVHPKTRQEWREWLNKNQSSSPGIWMIYYKKGTGKRKFSYADAVEEALCFGWIDCLTRKLDDERAMLKFTPRKIKSAWSELNKQRVQKLIGQKLMTLSGLVKVEQAKKDGSWNKSNTSNFHVKKNSLPRDLKIALLKKKNALENFLSFPQGYRKQFLFWIDSAKKATTRTARIMQTVLMAAANKRPRMEGFKM
jgi:uncharacterized protein YdeI (YjbR/CyaY-like superfamily)